MGMFAVCEAMFGNAAGYINQKITLPLNVTYEKQGVWLQNRAIHSEAGAIRAYLASYPQGLTGVIRST
jgi:hypothetical protein